MTFNREAFTMRHMVGEYVVDDTPTHMADDVNRWYQSIVNRIPQNEDKAVVKTVSSGESKNLLSHRTLEGFSADFTARIDAVMDGMREDTSYPYGVLYLTDNYTFLMQINRANEGSEDVPEKQVRRIRITPIKEDEESLGAIERTKDESYPWEISLWVQRDYVNNTHDIVYFDDKSAFRWSEAKDEKGKRKKLPIANTQCSLSNVEEQIKLMEYIYEAISEYDHSE